MNTRAINSGLMSQVTLVCSSHISYNNFLATGNARLIFSDNNDYRIFPSHINFKLQRDTEDDASFRSEQTDSVVSQKNHNLTNNVKHGVVETLIHESAHVIDKIRHGLGTKYLLPKVESTITIINIYNDVQQAVERRENSTCALVNSVAKNGFIIGGNVGVSLLTTAAGTPSGGASIAANTLGFIAAGAAAHHVGDAAQKICEKITSPNETNATTLSSSIRKLF